MERYLRVNLLGPGPHLMKKEFTGPRSHNGWGTLPYTTRMLSEIKQSNWTALRRFTLKVGTLDISASQTSTNIYQLTSRNAQHHTAYGRHAILSIQLAVNAVLLRQLLCQIRSACHLSRRRYPLTQDISDGCTHSKLHKQYLQNFVSWPVFFFKDTAT